MSFFNNINISSSGLTAEKMRMDIISENIANANTTRTASGTPYRRKMVVFKEQSSKKFADILNQATGKASLNGVEVDEIKEDQSDFKVQYDPTHPDSDENGYVKMPNVDIATEMINMITASRAYEANVQAINNTKSMANTALNIGR